jgi:hypothetical protein
MNVEIGTEAAQFPEKEYINGIFLAVQLGNWAVGGGGVCLPLLFYSWIMFKCSMTTSTFFSLSVVYSMGQWHEIIFTAAKICVHLVRKNSL